MLFDGNNILEEESSDFNTDKKKYVKSKRDDKLRRGSHFTKWYNFYFERIRNRKLNILEIGIAGGGSLNMWRNFFPNSKIYGVDINRKKLEENKKSLRGIKVFIGDQSDETFMADICESIPEGLDIIIDDGSHMNNHQIFSFKYLFNRMNSGGIYVIEDVHTSYRSYYRKKSSKSTIEYLKKRIDDINVHGRLERYYAENILGQEELSYYEKTVESIHFYPDICFIFKR